VSKRKLDLKFFEELLKEEKQNITSVISGNAGEVKNLIDDDSSSDEADHAFVSSNSMIRDVISNQQLKELKEVEIALSKIHKGTYGSCEMCDADIALERLKIKPYARYCIICRGIIEEERKKG
jgi:DnaK suppressor protein